MLAKFRDDRVIAYPYGNCIVRAADPVRYFGARRPEPCDRARPGIANTCNLLFRQGLQQCTDLIERCSDYNQACLYRSALEFKQTRYGMWVERVTTESIHRFGRVRDNTACLQCA